MIATPWWLRSALCVFVVAVFSGTAFPQVAIRQYHEVDCPSVDTTRMVRMKRHVAEAGGLIPAADCHPDARVRYLGVVGPSGAAPSVAESLIDGAGRPRTVHVGGYRRANGTWVDDYLRAPPQTVHVGGYRRANGTWVDDYLRAPPQ
jgi:hypothetical protein